MLVLSRDDSTTFAHRQQAVAPRPIRVIDHAEPFTAPREVSHWALHVWPGALRGCLGRAGVGLEQTQADTLPTIRELPGLTIWSVPRSGEASPDTVTGMNVIGILSRFATQESDRQYQDEPIVISAHMDRGSVGRGQVDPNGVNDNASGVAVLLELAKAFSRLDERARPRR